MRGDGNNPALEIHDTSRGIEFKNSDNLTTLAITENALSYKKKTFIEFSTNNDGVVGAAFKTNGMELNNNKISWNAAHGLSYAKDVFNFGELNENNSSTAIIKMSAREI